MTNRYKAIRESGFRRDHLFAVIDVALGGYVASGFERHCDAVNIANGLNIAKAES